MPSFFFFDSLSKPENYVIWRLFEDNPHEILKGFRKLMDTLNDQCHWNLDNKISSLKNQLKRPSNFEPNSLIYKRDHIKKKILDYNYTVECINMLPKIH